MQLHDYIGRGAIELFRSDRFASRGYRRSEEPELGAPISYLFEHDGVELLCDESDTITAIFLYPDRHGGCDPSLSPVSFSLTREQVRERLGAASHSGEAHTDSVLGERGAWDRYDGPNVAMHVEYRADGLGVRLVTLMNTSSAPTP